MITQVYIIQQKYYFSPSMLLKKINYNILYYNYYIKTAKKINYHNDMLVVTFSIMKNIFVNTLVRSSYEQTNEEEVAMNLFNIIVTDY